MEYVIRVVFTDAAFAGKAAAIGHTLKIFGQRLLIVSGLLAFTYGLLFAEVELAKLEGFPAAVVR